MIKIYSLSHPSSDRLYIGKTSTSLDERLKAHIYEGAGKNKSRKNNWLRSLSKKGLSPSINLIAEVSEEQWKEREIFYIKLARQVAPLDILNSPNCPGGEGFGKGHNCNASRMRTYKKNCPNCKIDFEDKPRRKDSIYCSRKCAGQAVAHKTKIQRAETRKVFTNEQLELIASRIRNGEFMKDIALEFSVNRMTLIRNLNGRVIGTKKLIYKKINK